MMWKNAESNSNFFIWKVLQMNVRHLLNLYNSLKKYIFNKKAFEFIYRIRCKKLKKSPNIKTNKFSKPFVRRDQNAKLSQESIKSW